MKLRGSVHITFAYIVTVGVAWVTLRPLGQSPIWDMFWADIAATIAILYSVVSTKTRASGHWSVIPPLIALYWAMGATASGVDSTRVWLVVVLVWLWGIRLTANWATFWPGLEHEDWRYAIKEGAGKLDALADFSAIHLFPTVIVFVSCLPIYAAVAMDAQP